MSDDDRRYGTSVREVFAILEASKELTIDERYELARLREIDVVLGRRRRGS
jgi:hypothetical protein